MFKVYDIVEESKNNLEILKQEIIETTYLAANLEGNECREYYENLPILILRHLKLLNKIYAIQNSANKKSESNEIFFYKEVDVIQIMAIINALEEEYKDRFDLKYMKR